MFFTSKKIIIEWRRRRRRRRVTTPPSLPRWFRWLQIVSVFFFFTTFTLRVHTTSFIYIYIFFYTRRHIVRAGDFLLLFFYLVLEPMKANSTRSYYIILYLPIYIGIRVYYYYVSPSLLLFLYLLSYNLRNDGGYKTFLSCNAFWNYVGQN